MSATPALRPIRPARHARFLGHARARELARIVAAADREAETAAASVGR